MSDHFSLKHRRLELVDVNSKKWIARNGIDIGTQAFKQNWYSVSENLYGRHHIAKCAGIPGHNPLSSVYWRVVAALKPRLQPVANVFGPTIVGELG